MWQTIKSFIIFLNSAIDHLETNEKKVKTGDFFRVLFPLANNLDTYSKYLRHWH